MTRLSAAAFGLVFLSVTGYGYGQDNKKATIPLILSWSEGRCLGCKIATQLGRVQFVSRKDAWAVGPKGDLGGGNFVVVHSTDAGCTWREVPQTHQYAGDPDGPPAFSFLDATRGWIAWWNPTDEPKIIKTRDGGQHWEGVSQQPLQRIQMVDDSRGYGTEAEAFLHTNDGGHSWVETKIPDIRFIDHMFFLTPELGWISGTAGVGGKDFFVFRTVNGGRDWKSPELLLHTALPAYVICSSSMNSAAGSSPGVSTMMVLICIPRLTEENTGRQTPICHFRGNASSLAWFGLRPEKKASSLWQTEPMGTPG